MSIFNSNYVLREEASDVDGGGGGEAAHEAIVEEVVESSEEVVEAASEASEEAVEAAAEEIEQAIEEGASAEEVKEMIETFKFKADGKDKEVTLDWNDKEDIIKRLQMAEAAPGALQRASEIEKAYKRDVDRLKNDFWGVAKDVGHDPDALAEARIQEQIERLQKTPEQLAQEERNAELEQLRQQVKQQEEDKKALEFAQLQKQAEIDLEAEITEAISATTQLPKSPYAMKRVADAMSWFMDQEDEQGNPKYPNIKATDVAPIVAKEITSEYNQLLETMPDDVLGSFMSKQVQDRLRKQRLNKMEPKRLSLKDTGKSATSEKKDKEIDRQSIRDFLKNGIK